MSTRRKQRTAKFKVARPKGKKLAKSDLKNPKRVYHKTEKDVAGFAKAFSRQMEIHNDNPCSLFRALVRKGEPYTDGTIANWAKGRATPRWDTSFILLERIERRYVLTRSS